MEDENGLELSLGLSWSRSSAKSKDNNDNSSETRADEGDRSNKLINDFKNFLEGGTRKQESSMGSQRSDPVKPDDSFCNNFSNAAADVDSSKNLNGRGLWVANDSRCRSAEVEEEKRPEASNKRKNLFDEMNNQKKRERESHNTDLHDKSRPSHISINTDDGSTAENEDVADSEVDGSTSRLVPHHDDGAKKYIRGAGPSDIANEGHTVTDSSVVDLQGQNKFTISSEREFKIGHMPYVSFPAQSINIMNVPYSLPLKESNSIGMPSTPSYPLPGMMQVMSAANGDRGGTQPVMPGNLPVMFGYSPVHIPVLDKDNPHGSAHPQQLHPSYVGRVLPNSDKQNDGLKISQDVRKLAKDFRQSCVPSKDLKRLLDLPVHKRKAPLLLNFIPTYKSTLPDVPKRKKKSLSPPTATTQIASTSRTDQESTSDPINQPSTLAPYLIPVSERKRRRRLVKTAEMGRPKPVVQDLLADLPADVDVAPTQSMPPRKAKRIKKAQPKAKATEAKAEDALPISQLAESKKSASTSAKRSAEAQPSGSTQSKKPRSSSATTSGSKIPKVPWRPEITLEDKPVLASDSADDINVGVALSTALLLPGDLERNAKMSEYENYAFMLQHSIQAIQNAHSFSMQAFETREKLADMKKEVSALKKENKAILTKMKKLEDQVEAATKAQQMAEEKAESAEAIKKVAEAEKKDAEVKKAQAEKELEQALATKNAEITEADEKAYAQGMADVAEDYKLQVRQACNRGFSLGWMSLAKKLNVPEDSPLHKAEAIPLSFPPPAPSSSQAEDEAESEAEDEDNNEDEALVRKSKDATEAKSPPSTEQVMDLTLDEEGDEVREAPREAVTGILSSDLLLAERSLDKTLAEIDAELAAEKAAEVVPQESAEVQTQIAPETKES